ncbi:flagellar hook-basal body complex protein FliE [Donghicola tyrosinivorans]|jgi:flagellar hook-basal body complex protein FliE|uniref:Flagellar hook-basal body complex protein FliE n=1 Tax=Donghicola tyrosinivorans TaxID=1652492 RepID=A0A2T0WIB9_9RHOB|nr:flagellar hook-basal body complex protein FliE [Donghicola tyrosinivorans]MEC9199453.1 flagellar hook-basal body complex protein FliE [Pseudomonadota bacterium]MEE3072368.1 flagellar hook-basal body complex protein FliE [Pseudomonadota bacterium]PRY86463.1 flagellar hook-basal body complex protein FliE [Donghicola tyrosinivorans]
MSINGPTSVFGALPLGSVSGASKPTETLKPSGAEGPSFGQRVNDALDNVANAQSNAAQSAKDYETGKTDDIASVMIEQQVASLGFQMTLQVRNKALNAYRDIMNMPV